MSHTKMASAALCLAPSQRGFHTTEEPYPLPNDAYEWERLDTLHKDGFSPFFDGKLSFAPIENPKRILDLGCGSGAWAIQAAQTYPDAQVTAGDISAMPLRPLPPNLSFQFINATEPLPFPPASFDVIHVRLMLVHLSHWEDALRRIIELLKPGGWLVIVDVEYNLYNFNGELPEGIKRFYEVYHSYTVLKHVDPLVGQKLESILKGTEEFSEVNTIQASAPFNGKGDDSKVAALGSIWRTSFKNCHETLDPKLVAHGLTAEIQKGLFDGIDAPGSHIYGKIYFTWSKKKEGKSCM